MIGIRQSFEFDFFTNKTFNAHFIYDELKKFYNDRILIVNVNDYDTCDVLIDNIKVSFFDYHYNMVNNFCTNELYENINIASIDDIA